MSERHLLIGVRREVRRGTAHRLDTGWRQPHRIGPAALAGSKAGRARLGGGVEEADSVGARPSTWTTRTAIDPGGSDSIDEATVGLAVTGRQGLPAGIQGTATASVGAYGYCGAYGAYGAGAGQEFMLHHAATLRQGPRPRDPALAIRVHDWGLAARITLFRPYADASSRSSHVKGPRATRRRTISRPMNTVPPITSIRMRGMIAEATTREDLAGKGNICLCDDCFDTCCVHWSSWPYS